MSNRESTTPILFSTSFQTLAEGGGAIPDTAELTSPFRRPMLIDEVRFSYISPLGVDATLAPSIRCKLVVGRTAITSTRDGGGFVPIWAFGPRLGGDKSIEAVTDAIFAANVKAGHFRWRLPKPLFIPAGQSIVPSFYRQQDGLGGTARVAVAVVGHQLGDAAKVTPAKVDVPFVAYYEQPVNQAASISSELDLVNPFRVPLNCQRFVFRIVRVIATTSITEGIAVNITMKDSAGVNIVGDSSSSTGVFDRETRSWTFARVLPPKQRYVVSISNANAGSAVTDYNQPQMSLIGWRQEAAQ